MVLKCRKQLCVLGNPWLTSWTMEILFCLHSFFSGSRDNKVVLLTYLKYRQKPWTTEFISILNLLSHVSHLTHLLLCSRFTNAHPTLRCLSAKWIELKSFLDGPIDTVVLRILVFWNHSIEYTGLPTCVCSARGAGLVHVCVTLPAQAVPLQTEVGLAGGPEERAGDRQLFGIHFQSEPSPWSLHRLCCSYTATSAQSGCRLSPFPA